MIKLNTIMKKSQLKKIIREEISKTLKEDRYDEEGNLIQPQISARKLLDLIARDLRFAGIYQDDEILDYREAVEIMNHVIEIEGADISATAALGEYIAAGEFN